MLVPLLVLLKIPPKCKGCQFQTKNKWLVVPSETASNIHALSAAYKSLGRNGLVSGVPEKASVWIQPHLFQAGHPKATFCRRCLEWGFRVKGGQLVFAFCIMWSEHGAWNP